MTGFAAINRFAVFIKTGGTLESGVAVGGFLKSSMTNGSTCSPNILMSSKRVGPTPLCCANLTVATDIGSKPAIVTAT